VSYHVFVDESVRQSYLLCAVWIDRSTLPEVRRAVRALRLRGQRRIHFSKEQPGRRRELLTAFVKLGATIRVYSTRGPALLARRRCMRALLTDIGTTPIARLTIESGDHENDVDRQVIFEMTNVVPGLKDVSYHHLRAFEEPMLWLADAFAWAYGAGPPWRRMIDAVLDYDRQV
jgi:hypothetical protein